MIIDAHAHYGPDADPTPTTDPSEWLAPLLAEGVDGVVATPYRSLYPALADYRAAHNVLAGAVAQSRGRMAAVAVVHPLNGHEALDEATRCLTTLGMRGVKLHPWLQGFPFMSGETLHDLCELCAEHEAPIIFHDGTPNVSMPSQVASLAKVHPRTTFVLGHAGILHLYLEAAEAAALHENVWATLCSGHPAALRHLVDHVPRDRILWGSDYILPNPACLATLHYRKSLIALLDLPEEDEQAILAGNAARLFRWTPRT